ncbi:LamG domain-containing protein [Candidatus Poribacteria bacterium]|nr:LamG domain-containing protein [Candidatus Poribacteria bacterium]
MRKIALLIGLTCLVAVAISSVGLAKVTKDDLCAVWLFDEGTGKKVLDSSGNGNDGEIIGDLKWVDGKFGKALQFPGESKNLVKIPNSDSLNPTKGITITAWGWLEDTDGNRRFLQKSTPGSDNQYRLLLEWGSFKFDAGPGVNPKEITTPIFSTKVWHHVAGVYDGKEIAIYIDGKKVAHQNASGEMKPSTGPVFIGAKWDDPAHPGDYWKGKIDEVAIFNRGLTEDEIKEVMEKGLKAILAPTTTPVNSGGKLAATWGEIKK